MIRFLLVMAGLVACTILGYLARLSDESRDWDSWSGYLPAAIGMIVFLLVFAAGAAAGRQILREEQARSSLETDHA